MYLKNPSAIAIQNDWVIVPDGIEKAESGELTYAVRRRMRGGSGTGGRHLMTSIRYSSHLLLGPKNGLRRLNAIYNVFSRSNEAGTSLADYLRAYLSLASPRTSRGLRCARIGLKPDSSPKRDNPHSAIKSAYVLRDTVAYFHPS
jgi:hypothetical protein